MASMKRVAGLSALLCGATQGVRTRRRSEAMQIAGVPVNNFHEGAEDFMILFKDGASDDTIDRVCQGQCDLVGHPSSKQGGVPFAYVKGRAALEKLLTENKDGVELVEPDVEDFAIPEMEVEELHAQKLASWGLDAVGAEKRGTTGKGVHVYVQDTGVRTTHRDFGGRAIPTLDYTSGKAVQCKGDIKCAYDGAGHGTHCAGTVAGTTYGVAPDAIIHAVKTLSDSGSGQRAWNIAAIDWALSNGERPTVISLSLGGKGQDASYKRAIETASMFGVTVVVAAGNFGSDSCTYSPAFVPAAITVGATDGNKRAGYSNWGTCNDIMAPGSAITSASPISDTMSTRMTGTSMACPHVSGAAALLLEKNPSWTSTKILGHLKEFAKKDFVTALFPGDPDLFLWVGKDLPAGKPTCPSSATSTAPDYWGDCTCSGGKRCSKTGGPLDCPGAYGVGGGGYGPGRFNWECTECKCI